VIFQASPVAPVLPAPSAWQGNQDKDEPNDNDCAQVWERVVYRGSKQAADGNEKDNKK
jgi:hypothetical protein